MSETLGNASPEQLLMFMALPVVGVIIFAVILIVAFSAWRNKQQMKLNLSAQPVSPQTFPVVTPSEISPNLFNAPIPPPVSSQAPVPEASILGLTIPTELTLNPEILSQPTEMEVEMMHLSKPSREPKTGLSARLGNQARPAAAPVPPAASQPVTVPTTLPVAVVTEPVRTPAPAARPAEPVELLRLLRDPQTGQLIVEIAGRRYTKLAEIADKEIGQYILNLAAHLLAFTNGMVATDAGLKTLQAPKVGPAPQPVVTSGPASSMPQAPVPATPAFAPQPASVAEAAFLASLQAKPALEPSQPQRRGLFGGKPKPAQEEPLIPMLNLAGQINEIAQIRLRYSPLAATTKLEITSDPRGGILINVNGAFYHGPDDIPYPEVKELIKASIQEWERS